MAPRRTRKRRAAATIHPEPIPPPVSFGQHVDDERIVHAPTVPPPLLNPATGAPFVGVAAIPPTHPGVPPRYHGWAVPAEGRRVSVGKSHASPEAAARARDRAAIALKGRAAFTATKRAGRTPALNFPLAAYPPSDDFQRFGDELASFLRGLAKSGSVRVARGRSRLPGVARCGVCDACRRPWLKRACAGKEEAQGVRRAARRAVRPAAPPPGHHDAPTTGPSASVTDADAAVASRAHAQAVASEAAAALVGAARAAGRAARLPPGAALDPCLCKDPYAPTAPSLEAWIPHDYGADLAAAAAAAAAGGPVLVPRPGARGGNPGVAAARKRGRGGGDDRSPAAWLLE